MEGSRVVSAILASRVEDSWCEDEIGTKYIRITYILTTSATAGVKANGGEIIYMEAASYALS
jgi:hypothetical protein